MKPVRSFALVLVLFLVAMMAVGAAALSMIASTESLLCRYAANDLDHQLALDSLIDLLPVLLPQAKEENVESQETRRRLDFAYGQVRVQCVIRPNASKRLIADRTSEGITATLRQMAQENGLNPQHVNPKPIITRLEEDKSRSAAFVWFDQLVEPQDFEEVVPWTLPQPGIPGQSPRKTWSDLITFWASGSLSLMAETSLGADVRRWCVVVQMKNGAAAVLFRGSI